MTRAHRRPGPEHLLAALSLLLPLSASGAEPSRPAAPPARVDERIESSVVQVFSTVRYPDLSKPWTKQAPHDITGTGVVIEGQRILTNAHVVLYASQVQIQASRAGDKLMARVEAVAPGIDLALLSVEDRAFFDTHPPLARDRRIPSARETVLTYGFPTGGTTLAVSKGIVSRTEFASYRPDVFGLRIQIDGAVNPGNSGGPTVADDKMVGLVFGKLGNGTQNIGYLIPTEEIDLFLAAAASGRSDGKPMLNDDIQTLENEALRAFLKLDPSVRGVVVHQPFRSDASYPLKKWDVITKVGGVPVDDQGNVWVDGVRLGMGYLVQKLSDGHTVPLTVWRGGREAALRVPVEPRYPYLVHELRGAYPPFFIYGPFVFSTLSTELVQGLLSAKNNAAMALVYGRSAALTRAGDKAAFPGEELVVVSSPLFPHRLARGYGSFAGQIVKSVNGTPVNDLRHLVEILRDARDEFVVLEFAFRFSETVVLRRAEAVAATEEILNDNGIRAQGSPELMAIWNGKRAGAVPR